MENVIVALVILFILGLSLAKVVLDKKKGVKCMGCSHGAACSSSKKNKSAINVGERII
ncbi:FeoB-associated Cys-rich membrane protein [Vibrio sp. RC27]